MGYPAGDLATLASCRPGALCSLAYLPTWPSMLTLQSSHAFPRACCCAILEAPAARLHLPAGQGCCAAQPSQLGRDPCREVGPSSLARSPA